jgi:uncharacterized protein YdaU (DUF1376 family)
VALFPSPDFSPIGEAGFRRGRAGPLAFRSMAERKKPLPYLRWYVTDYRASRRVQRLSWQERGIYRELLDECWVEGCIPDDPAKLAEIADCPLGVIAEAWPRIRPLFTPIDGLDGMYLTSPRLEAERSDDDAFRVIRANAGRKGGLAKASKAKQSLASSSEQFRAEQSSSGASAGSAQPLGGAASPADRLATHDEIRAIFDGMRGPK